MPTGKRKALLRPRGLFDFISRSAVGLAVLVYFVHIALLLYIDQHPFPGFAGLPVNIAAITLIYAAMTLAVYVILRKVASSSMQALEDRMRSVGVAVRVCVYTCILCVGRPVAEHDAGAARLATAGANLSEPLSRCRCLTLLRINEGAAAHSGSETHCKLCAGALRITCVDLWIESAMPAISLRLDQRGKVIGRISLFDEGTEV